MQMTGAQIVIRMFKGTGSRYCFRISGRNDFKHI